MYGYEGGRLTQDLEHTPPTNCECLEETPRKSPSKARQMPQDCLPVSQSQDQTYWKHPGQGEATHLHLNQVWLSISEPPGETLPSVPNLWLFIFPRGCQARLRFPESHLQPTRTPLAWPQRVPTAFLKRAPIPTQREALGRWPGARELHSLQECGNPAVNRLGLGEQQTATNSFEN